MADPQNNGNGTHERSWLERLGQALLGEPKDHAQLLEMLQNAVERDILDRDALQMIESILEFGNISVRQIMVPRSQMVVVEHDAPLEAILPVVRQSGHSRFPVIGEDKDHIMGILLAKDLLAYAFDQDQSRFHLHDMLRQATFIPENKRINVLLKDFRINRNHMAIVVDEYGGVSGLVTIEDILEEIVGEIADEHDIETEEDTIQEINPGEFRIQALTPIDEFNDYFNTQLIKEDVDTVGGLVLQGFGYLPKRGESIIIDDFQFTIFQADKRRIRQLTVKPVSQRKHMDTPHKHRKQSTT